METKSTLNRLFLIAIVVAFTASMAWSQGGTTLPKFNIFNDANLVLETEKLNDFDYKFKIVPKDQPDQAKTFVVMPLTQETFVNTFMKEMGDIGTDSSVCTSLTDSAKVILKSITRMKAEATRIFLYVQASGITSASLSFEPIAGTLCLRNEIEIRQHLRINSLRLQKYSGDFQVIKIRRMGALANGRVKSGIRKWGYETKNNGNRKYGWERIRFPEIDSNQKYLAGYSPGKRTFVLVDTMALAGKTDSTGGVFETFRNKSEAFNRLDYKAMQKLSESLAGIIDVELSHNTDHEKKISDYQKEKLKKQDSINDLEGKLKTLRQQVDLRNICLGIKNTKKDEFNREGKAIDYSMNDTFAITIRVYPQQEAVPVPISEYESKNRFLKGFLEDEIDEAKKFRDVLNKMILNQKRSRVATEKLTGQDKNIIFQINRYKREYFNLEQIIREKAILSDYQKKDNGDLDNENKLNEKYITEREKKFETIRRLDILLDSLAEINSSIRNIEEKINSLGNEQEIRGKISQLQDTIRLLEDKTQSEREGIKINRKTISELQAQNPLVRFKIEYTNIEFNQGFIENIVVYGSIVGRPEEKIKFTNVMPIGFSRKKDFDDLANYDLWTEPTSNNNRSRYSMNLGDFFENYLQNLGLNRRDYSPADGAMKIDLEKGTCVELKKAPTYRLLEGKVFSDFVGLDEKSPNGLIQTEIGQKINLRTSRVGRYYWGKGGILGESKRLMYRSRSYVNRGYLGYIHPLLTLSKIENKNRSLLLDSRDRIVNNEYLQDRYISSMQLRNHEYLSAGCDLNLVTWDRPTLKSTLYFDLGFRFGRTQVIDSVRSVIDSIPQNNGEGSEFGVNTFRFYPKLILEIKPEERYGLSMSYAWNQYYLLHPTITQVAVPERYKAIGQNRLPYGYGTFELQAFFNPSAENPTGKLFFRYSFNHQGLNLSTNFHQAQVGYSFFLLGRNKVRTQPD